MSDSVAEESSNITLGHIGYGVGDCLRVAEGDEGLNPRDVLGAFLWNDGFDIDARSPEVVQEGLGLLCDGWMRTVIKADTELIEDAEPGMYHTEGSGARTKHFWWVESNWHDYLEKIDASD